jgi:hypothetical protein
MEALMLNKFFSEGWILMIILPALIWLIRRPRPKWSPGGDVDWGALREFLGSGTAMCVRRIEDSEREPWCARWVVSAHNGERVTYSRIARPGRPQIETIELGYRKQPLGTLKFQGDLPVAFEWGGPGMEMDPQFHPSAIAIFRELRERVRRYAESSERVT